jgi:hypothetical protein
LAVTGGGFRYTYEERNKRTDEVTQSFTETGNFGNTRLYLLDEDADVILQRAGVETGIFQTRYEMLAFYDGGAQVVNMPGLASIPALFGQGGLAEEISRDAKADFDCAMASVRAHAVAEVTTDAMARGAFPAVPAGVYYLFARFYRLEKPVRRGGLMWSTKMALRPGANRYTLSVGDAVWTGR